MFGWFRSKAECPVEPPVKEWLERRMTWLVSQFGWEQLCTAEVILPTPTYFPDPFNATDEDATALLTRVCDYMYVWPVSVELSFYQDNNPVHQDGRRFGTAPLFSKKNGKFQVWVEVNNLDDLPSLSLQPWHKNWPAFT